MSEKDTAVIEEYPHSFRIVRETREDADDV
jgi:hypothetical protein